MGIGRSGVVAAATTSFAFGSLVLPAAALAGQSSAVSGTIALDTALMRTADGTPALKYGDSAHFKTTVQGRLDPKGALYVRVVCWQGDNVVYQWSADPSFSFPLVDQPSVNLVWDGTAALCTAELIYKIDSRKTTLSFLDEVEFPVDAASS